MGIQHSHYTADAGNPRLRTTGMIEKCQVTDLHVWQVGPGQYAAIVALQADQPAPPARYKAQLAGVAGLVHVTVEVNASAG